VQNEIPTIEGERVKQALDAMSENWRKHPLEWPNGCEVREFDGLIGLYEPGAKQPRVWMSKPTAVALGLWEEPCPKS
jgi:hypothetical protein